MRRTTALRITGEYGLALVPSKSTCVMIELALRPGRLRAGIPGSGERIGIRCSTEFEILDRLVRRRQEALDEKQRCAALDVEEWRHDRVGEAGAHGLLGPAIGFAGARQEPVERNALEVLAQV